jgi:hypothetical protein
MPREDDMSEDSNASEPADERDREEQQQEIADVDEQLDAQAGGEGLAAEADRGEATGISEG